MRAICLRLLDSKWIIGSRFRRYKTLPTPKPYCFYDGICIPTYFQHKGGVTLARYKGGNSTKRLDLLGQRFGKLVVVARAENIGRDTAWLCKCDCGNERVVRTAALRRRNVSSCGCNTAVPLLAGTKRYDLTGQRFGKLVAIKPLGARDGKNYRWLCRCDCGNEVSAQIGNLRNGKTTSCGCDAVPLIEYLHYVDGTNVELIRSKTVRSNNSSGVTGVHWVKKEERWAAAICFKGKRYHLGLFERFADAVEARKEAEQQYFGTFLANYDAAMGAAHAK